MKRAKIMFVIPSLRGGGAEKIILNIINILNKELFECILVSFSSKGEYLSLVPEDIKFISFNKKRARDIIFKLRRLIKKEKPAFVFSSVIQANIAVHLSSLFLKNKFINIIKIENHYSSIIKRQKLIPKFLFNKTILNSDKIITVSEGLKKDLKYLFPNLENRIINIYNPTNIEEIKKKLKEEYIFDKPNNIIACGRLVEQKGFEYLIKSIPLVKKEFNDINLYILGKGEKEQYLKN
jgi:glycosyltransferase involved in cell wall biosynthesis